MAKVQGEGEPDASSSSVLTTQTFASLGVCKALQEACQRLEWKFATQIQASVLAEALSKESNDDVKNNNNKDKSSSSSISRFRRGRDIIGLAETGSGKTGAFCLPILQGLLEHPVRATAALILTPTRELAFQIHVVVQGLGQGMGATSACVVGGVDRTSQAIALARLPHIVIATPGRLLDHLKDTKGFHLRQVRYLVLDEADRMLSMDFEEELLQLLDNMPSERQTFLFSATMTSQVQKLQRASLTDPVRIEVSTKFQTPSQLQQSYLFIPAKYKDCYFTYIINEHAGKSILVFGATCNNVQRLALMLRNLGFPAVCLHGQMNQAKRLGALQKFSTGARTILLCTDVASRGLDLPSVDLVINYDLPGHGKEYIHRVGRTARAGQSGQALALVTQYDVEIYQRLEVLLGKKLPAYTTADEETVLVLLERVSEAQRLATRELKEQLSSSSKHGHGGGGGRRKRRGLTSGDDGGEDGGGEASLKRELRQKYAGGSGGSGGALPNQRGAGGKPPKKHRRRG
ncbi:hypothetical protein ACA910_021991 [Epithemia clementina (nom. ined.)]